VSPPGGRSTLIARLTTSHVASRRLPHGCPTDPQRPTVSPGQGALTASFATRKSRVQIPPAPLNALVRALSAISNPCWLRDRVIRCPTHAPQEASPEHLAANEGVTGSNPVSSTKFPGQGDFSSSGRSLKPRSWSLTLHRRPTGCCGRSTSSSTRCFLTPSHIDQPSKKMPLRRATATTRNEGLAPHG